jgi:competence protein ComEA
VNDDQQILKGAGLKLLAVSVVIALPFIYATGQSNSAKPGTPDPAIAKLPNGPGKELIVKKCTSCHSVQSIVSKRNSADDWAQVVSQMIGRGATISDDDADTIVDYLATNFGPSSPKPNGPAPSSDAASPASSSPSAASADNKDKGSNAINVNKATAAELRSLLHLTQDEADKIVHYRDKNGEFENLEQLLAAIGGDDAAKIRNEQSKIKF